MPPEILAQLLEQQAPQQTDQPSTCPIWPDTVIPLALLRAMSTQWVMGPNGPVGLRYESLPWAARMAGVPLRKLTAPVLADLRTMELAALAWEPPHD